MSNKNNSLAGRQRQRSAVWFALLSIAWLQLSSAAHELDHTGEPIGESCQVCLQFDRADDAAADNQAAAAIAPVVASVALPSAADDAGLAYIRNFDSRAPPQL